MKYFRLFDDLGIKGRWHLGETFDGITGLPLELWRGTKLDCHKRPVIEVSEPGNALDFSLTSFAVPVAAMTVADAVGKFAGNQVQRIPVDIVGYRGFEVLNAITMVSCLDENRSEYVKWTKKDHRSDLAGQYRMVTRLRIDVKRVPSEVSLFRIEGWRIALIVSETIRTALDDVGTIGARFEEVTE